MADTGLRPFEPVLDLWIGQALLDIGEAVAAELRKELGRSDPPASQEGEFPARRSGTLQASVVVEPSTAQEAGRRQAVQVGYSAAAPYGRRLVEVLRRLGPADVLARYRGALARVLERGESAGRPEV